MFTLIIMAVGAAAAAVGGAVKRGKEQQAASIQGQADAQARAMQAAYARIAAKGQAIQDYSIAVSDAQLASYKRARLVRAMWFGLPLLAGVFLLLAVRMPKRKRKTRKGKKR